MSMTNKDHILRCLHAKGPQTETQITNFLRESGHSIPESTLRALLANKGRHLDKDWTRSRETEQDEYLYRLTVKAAAEAKSWAPAASPSAPPANPMASRLPLDPAPLTTTGLYADEINAAEQEAAQATAALEAITRALETSNSALHRAAEEARTTRTRVDGTADQLRRLKAQVDQLQAQLVAEQESLRKATEAKVSAKRVRENDKLEEEKCKQRKTDADVRVKDLKDLQAEERSVKAKQRELEKLQEEVRAKKARLLPQ